MRLTIESNAAMADVSYTMVVYTMVIYSRLKGTHPDVCKKELRERLHDYRLSRLSLRAARPLDCGAQDRAYDAFTWNRIKLLSMLNAMRLLRGSVHVSFQRAVMEAVGL